MLSDWSSSISSHSVGYLQALVEIKIDIVKYRSTRRSVDGFGKRVSGSLHAWICLAVSVSVCLCSLTLQNYSGYKQGTVQASHAGICTATPGSFVSFRRILEKRKHRRCIGTDGSDGQWRGHKPIFN